jgi:hypothetical protein
MSKYTERLWRELVRDHGSELARVSRPERHGRVARPRLLAGTTVGLVGLGTALALVLGAASSSPAFAVTQGNDGTVHVVIRQIDALHSVNVRLAQLGYRARFVPAAPGCAAPRPPAMRLFAHRQWVHVGSVSVVSGFVHARFDPKQIPIGKTLVITAWRQGQQIKAGSGHVVLGAVPKCLPLAAPVMGAMLHASGGSGGPVQCFVRGLLRPADNPPTTTTGSGVPTTTTGSGVPTTTTSTGAPQRTIVAPACPPAAAARVMKAIALARRAADKH